MSAVPEKWANPLTDVADSDFATIRKEFGFLDAHPQLAYLDSAASTQKPHCVIAAISDYYAYSHANIHRGVYKLSQEATNKYDAARACAARFIGAQGNDEIVFIRGTTEGFNLLARSFLAPRVKKGDEVLVSVAEHHANIVPWQMVCREIGAELKTIGLTEDHRLNVEELEQKITARTKLISLTHVSNALGSVTDLQHAISIAKQHSIPIAIDGAQAVAHLPVDVTALDCDFYLFSGHKLYGPTGIGVLYAKAQHLAEMPPYQGGGDMIEYVSFAETTYQAPPQRFEAGTPHIAGAVGLAEAMRFVSRIGLDHIAAHERNLQTKTEEVLHAIPGITQYGPKGARVGGISFSADWAHPHDIGTILDQKKVAVRTGHHCAQPLMRHLGVAATTRISFGVYNNESDIEQFAEALEYARKLFA